MARCEVDGMTATPVCQQLNFYIDEAMTDDPSYFSIRQQKVYDCKEHLLNTYSD